MNVVRTALVTYGQLSVSWASANDDSEVNCTVYVASVSSVRTALKTHSDDL